MYTTIESMGENMVYGREIIIFIYLQYILSVLSIYVENLCTLEQWMAKIKFVSYLFGGKREHLRRALL